MPWAAAATIAVGAYSASQQKKSAAAGANASTAASQAAIDEQRRQYDQNRTDQQPWMQAGGWALGQQQNFLNGDTSGFMNSPDYKWSTEQGMKALEGSAASRGGLFGGGNTRDIIKFGQGNAQQYADNYYSKLSGLSGTGLSSAQNLGAAGQNMASQIGRQYNNIGDARASSYAQQADANSQLAGVIGNSFSNWYQDNSKANGGGSGWYVGNNPGRG